MAGADDAPRLAAGSTVFPVRIRADLLVGVPAAAGAVVLVTAAVDVLDPHVPILSLGALYVFAVLPVALFFGTGLAVLVSVASMLAFNWFFLPPRHTFHLRESGNWLALTVYLGTAVVVSALAARARRRRQDAEQRRAEAHALAETASDLLRGVDLEQEAVRLAELAGGVLHLDAARLEFGEVAPAPGERALPLAVVVDRSALESEALEAEALRRSDALKTALLRAVSHDLRSPLTAILAAAGALANPDLRLGPDDREALVGAIREEAARLDRVVGDLLDLSRLEAGAVDPHRELWPADELVARALESVGDEGGRVIVELDEGAPPVLVDAAQIERVLANLIGNALAFSPPRSPVVVRVEPGTTELRVHVVDRGPGLTPAEREAIFRPFRRGTAAAGAPRGSGVGLAIARGFTEANGGELWTQEDVAGGHFVLALPVAARPVGV